MPSLFMFFVAFFPTWIKPLQDAAPLPIANHEWFTIHCQASPDEAVFNEKIKIAAQQNTLVEKALAVGLSFKGTPYEHGTLDGFEPEGLVVNLRQLDCWTFVENSVAIALCAHRSQTNFADYQSQLQQLRYWGGTIDGFGSRIHYFTGWILQQGKRGILQDVTQALGGVPYQKTTNYITAHPIYYPQLEDATVKENLKKAEKRVQDHDWYYIPKKKVAKMEQFIHEGDIVATTSSRADLDISHQGFAVRIKGRIHLLHASSVHKKVIVSALPLAEYLARNPGQSGILVARLFD